MFGAVDAGLILEVARLEKAAREEKKKEQKKEGLYNKYRVKKLNGKEVGPCIVMEFKDPLARRAIYLWAREMLEEGYTKVYIDTLRTLKEHQNSN